MELHSNQEVQPNAQKDILEPLVKLLVEIAGSTDITLKNNIFPHEQETGGAPTARVVQKTIKLEDGRIQYHSHTGIYEITNPYVSRSPETVFKHTDLSSTPTFMSDSACVFTKDGMHLRQSLYNGHITKQPISTSYQQGSGELNFWIFGVVMEIISYIREQIRFGLLDLELSSEFIDAFADSLVELMYEKLGELENKSNEKLDMDIHTRNHLGEILPAAGIKSHSIEFTADDATTTFTRLCHLLKLKEEDSAKFDEAYAASLKQMDDTELKEFLSYLSTKFPIETMEAAAISFPQETGLTIPHIWGESIAFNLDLNSKQWLIRTITRPQAQIAADGEVIYPEVIVNSSFNGSANLNSVLVLLGLLGYVSPMYSLKAYQG